MKIRGVIFDMDGTITAPSIDFDGMREAAGIPVGTDILEYVTAATGTEADRLRAVMQRFEDVAAARSELNPGARELLDFLENRRLPTGLLTRNTRRSVDTVCRKLALRFDAIITREDGPHKPAPEPIWQMAGQWNLKPEEILMVGDYKWDMLCAHNAGARSVVLVNGSGLPDWAREANHVVHLLTEVIEIIEGKHR